MKGVNTGKPFISHFRRPNQTYRSVNLKLDLDDPALISAYLPTQKSVSALDAILESFDVGNRERANTIVAPYGSGKSSLLLYLWALLEGQPSCRRALNEVQRRVAIISPRTAKRAERFVESRTKFLAVVLSGEHGPMAEVFSAGLTAAFKRRGLGKFLTAVRKKLAKRGVGNSAGSAIDLYTAAAEELSVHGYSGIVVLFDEFGKVLESQQSNSRPEDLMFLQTFAELCSRSDSPQIQLILSLHQGFAQYAHRLPAYTRNEWAKIEGRFRTFHFVEDSVQVYELIAQAVTRLRYTERESASANIGQLSKQYSIIASRLPAFSAFQPAARLAQLLERVYPLNPVALYALPRLSARVAQNERTLFHFLLGQDPGCLYPLLSAQSKRDRLYISVADLFTYFTDLMMKDTGVGGVYRRYIEINTALERAGAGNPLIQDLIKAIGIISIINEPGKLPTTRTALDVAVGALTEAERGKVEEGLRELVEKKILLHRPHSDEYRIWEGADVDLIGILRHKKAECEDRFDAVAFVGTKVAAPPILAHRYNEDFGIVRHFEGVFCSSEGVRATVSSRQALDSSGQVDGKVYYVIAESASEIAEALRLAKEAAGNRQILFAIPRAPLGVFEPLLELYCLEQLLSDSTFVSQDPVLQRELAELSDDCLTAVQRRIVRFLEPRNEEAIWIYRGAQRDGIKIQADLKRLVSDACRDVFPFTPRFYNELINRRSPSTTIVNARKKLIRAMLQNLADPNLGLTGYGPEVSIFRALLLRTGIYRTDLRTFARSDQIDDPCVRRAMRTIEDFFYASNRHPRAVVSLIDELMSPPLGLRAGVIPILLACVVEAFPLPLNILDEGVYVKDLKAEVFEKMLYSPKSITIQCIQLPQEVNGYIASLPTIFGSGSLELATTQSQRTLLQNALESIYRWLHALPSCALTTQKLGSLALALRTTLVRATDPAALVLEEIPSIYLAEASFVREGAEITGEASQKVLSGLRSSVSELDACKGRLVDEAQLILRKIFSRDDWNTQEGTIRNLRRWVEGLSRDVKDYLEDPQCAGFISRVMSNYEDDVAMIESLCSLVTGRSISYWDDNFLRQFELGILQLYKKIRETDSLLKTRDVKGSALEVLARALAGGSVNQSEDSLAGTSRLSERLFAAKSEIERLVGGQLQKLSREERARVLVELLKEEL